MWQTAGNGGKILDDHARSWRRIAWPAMVNFLRHGHEPVLCGPWYGEVGFEVMYWIPFLRHLQRQAGIDPGRFRPVTRGGAGAWYGAEYGIELYALQTAPAIRVQNRVRSMKTGSLKQDTVTKADKEVMRVAARVTNNGESDYVRLHPAWMYHLLAPFWTGRRGLQWLLDRTDFPLIPPPQLPATITLPAHFVAVRFYSRETFNTNDPTVRDMIKATVQTISQKIPVVVLSSDAFLDDHSEGLEPFGPNVLHLRDLAKGAMTVANNLAIQSAVLARAEAFVGTYGGFAQLALRLGRPVVSFYTKWGGTSYAHKHVSDFLAHEYKIPFLVLSVNDLTLTSAILPHVEHVLEQSPQKQVAAVAESA